MTEQINALLGDADAPDRWHYRSLQLLTAGDTFTGLKLARQPVCADPQATSGCAAISLLLSRLRESSDCRPVGRPPMALPSVRVTCPTLVWRTSTYLSRPCR